MIPFPVLASYAGLSSSVLQHMVPERSAGPLLLTVKPATKKKSLKSCHPEQGPFTAIKLKEVLQHV